jgi:hypothetical protein
MSIPVISGAAVTAAALLDAAALIEQAGVGGLSVTCYQDRVSILAGTWMGDARSRAAVVAALGELAGAARCRQHDIAGEKPGAWLEAAGQAGGTVIEVTTPLAVRAVPGGTLAAGPGGQRAVIAAGQQFPAGWRWVTDLDEQPGGQPARRQEVA